MFCSVRQWRRGIKSPERDKCTILSINCALRPHFKNEHTREDGCTAQELRPGLDTAQATVLRVLFLIHYQWWSEIVRRVAEGDEGYAWVQRGVLKMCNSTGVEQYLMAYKKVSCSRIDP